MNNCYPLSHVLEQNVTLGLSNKITAYIHEVKYISLSTSSLTVPLVEDNSWTAIGIGVAIGLPAVVVGFMYILKRYRNRNPGINMLRSEYIQWNLCNATPAYSDILHNPTYVPRPFCIGLDRLHCARVN